MRFSPPPLSRRRRAARARLALPVVPLLLALPVAATPGTAGGQRPAALPATPADTVPADTVPADTVSRTPPANAEAAPGAAPGDAARPSLVLHGYFTQGAAVSQRGMVYGIPGQGTLDYRRAAVLARYAFGDADRLVVQVANRRRGDSPTMRFHDAVKLDWAFYERSFGDHTRLRAGRIPIPMGIHNETRYVGELLPFYQAPASFYRESEFTNEAIDGALVSHELFAESATPVQLSAYAGSMDYVEAMSLPTPPAGEWRYLAAPARARGGAGFQVWMQTPLPGLRVGGGALRARLSDGILRLPGREETAQVWTTSVDGRFERATVRAELVGLDLAAVRLRGGYVQAGLRVAGPLSVNAQFERTRATIYNTIFPEALVPRRIAGDIDRDLGLGVTWSFSRSLQLKVEGHLTRGYNVEAVVDYFAAPVTRRYAISSLSVSF